MRKYKKNNIVDSEKLSKYAERLDYAIKCHLGESKDVDFLASMKKLNVALNNAKNKSIIYPYKLGLGHWILESNIQRFMDIANNLAAFEWLLDGWELPSEEEKGDEDEGELDRDK